mmetsp:Transcript_12190/g.15936  ORF Transcript_12190/g.15936 Transcript_12190/m.15936 type:complete len:311 (-) Transcript_12190:133-1065(-)
MMGRLKPAKVTLTKMIFKKIAKMPFIVLALQRYAALPTESNMPPKIENMIPNPEIKKGNSPKRLGCLQRFAKRKFFSFDGEMFDLVGAVRNLLRCCDSEIVGKFRDSDTPEQLLEDFVVPVPSTWRSVNGGQCESAQKYLSDQVAQNEDLLNMFDRLVQEAILPHLKKRLVSVGAVSDDEDSVTFYYQRPPTLRLQPGPGWASVKAHNDAEYGHQNGELNFWLPLTDFSKNNIHLWCESDYSVGDYHTIPAKVNQAVSFHGSSCRHYVNSNITQYTRMSLDFRVGVQGFFDPRWQMRGTTDDLGRKEFML